MIIDARGALEREIDVLVSRNSALRIRVESLESAMRGIADMMDLEDDMLIVEFPEIIRSCRRIIGRILEEK